MILLEGYHKFKSSSKSCSSKNYPFRVLLLVRAASAINEYILYIQVNDLTEKQKKPASESLMPKASKTNKPEKAEKSEKAAKSEKSTATARSGGAAAQKKSSAKTASEAVSESASEPKKARKPIDENAMLFHLLPILLGAAAVFTAIFLAFPDGVGFCGTVAYWLRGLLSYGAWAIPFFMLLGAIQLKNDMRRGRVMQKFIFGIIGTVFVSILAELALLLKQDAAAPFTLFSDFSAFWQDAKAYRNGGVIGGALGAALHRATGGAAIYIASFLVVILALFQFGCTPEDVVCYLRDKLREICHNLKNRRREEYPKRESSKVRPPAASTAASDSAAAEKRPHTAYKLNRDLAYHLNKKTIDIDTEDHSAKKQSVFDLLPDDAGEKRRIAAEKVPQAQTQTQTAEAPASDVPPSEVPFDLVPPVSAEHEEVSAAPVEGASADAAPALDNIFADDAVIAAGGVSMNTSVLEKDVIDTSGSKDTRSAFSDADNDEDPGLEVISGRLTVTPRPTQEELYEYPSTELLTADPNPTTYTVTDELKATAVKLVDTLSKFGVRTKITNISCGPTITRYELQPELGIRVKSIQNLSDDIALHLAASGVRIEAPIPGKDAVGIEIPNKTVSTVYIRDLIENPQFRTLKSRVSVCLGMDVAGSPVYMDIAKMPHLLIAGATGMGKSVCINTFIISILYKARPDEVKFILIDPKKVEFNMYKKIPHLLVPVVSDPKKAAGALMWAVSEMERRYVLIEEVGARNITGYNETIKDDPEKTKMCQIVIIIDELADLMMTARDEVETSICRLAQKARAAGMYLVIGTQRPSVDVITGLIKANIPSRIACTVASQVDSRTIIDVSGAEKLIGRGDMLFVPVGSLKPIRVQGAFVSDAEVTAVAEFLSSHVGAEYDKSIIEDIEREAAHCGEKKKGRADTSSSDEDDARGGNDLADSDEMIMPAIQVAVSAGQLSTSLLQRKLSLGYARAARIVDILEQMGVVSAFEGSKPRRVLITEQQYLEMRMRQEHSDT